MKKTQLKMFIYHRSFQCTLSPNFQKKVCEALDLAYRSHYFLSFEKQESAINVFLVKYLHPHFFIKMQILLKRLLSALVHERSQSSSLNFLPWQELINLQKKFGMAGQYSPGISQNIKQAGQLSILLSSTKKYKELYDQIHYFHYMAEREKWMVTFQENSTTFAQITRNLLSEKEREDQAALEDVATSSQMKVKNIKEAKNIINYLKENKEGQLIFQISQMQALIAMSKITHTDPRILLNKLEIIRPKIDTFQKDNAKELQTCRAKIEVCFSSSWREEQVTIYLLIHNFVTPEKTSRIRILILNQRGLILQVLSNIDPSRYLKTIPGKLKNSYSHLKNLVIYLSLQECVDLDCMDQFQKTLPKIRVFLFSSNSRQKLSSLKEGSLSACQSWKTDLSDSLLVTLYTPQEIAIWHQHAVSPQFLNAMVTKLCQILARQATVKHFFKDFQYELHQFNQKQFLLRLFAFYFNFITLQKMDGQNQDNIKDTILAACTERLLQRKKEMEEKRREKNDVHTFTTHTTPLLCPICKGKSKIKCEACCQEYETMFGLCQAGCFQEFHQDRAKYEDEVKKRGKKCDFSLQNKSKIMFGSEIQAENQSFQSLDKMTPPHVKIKTIQQLKEKWRKTLENQQNEFDQFMKMRQMNFIPKKFVDRIDLLRQKIQQITLRTSLKKVQVKYQE